jgi:hemolysin III
MIPFDLREPISAWSHGAGLMMALPVTLFLWNRCKNLDLCKVSSCALGGRCRTAGGGCPASRHQRLKALSLLVFGLSLMTCYAASAVFHGVPYRGAPLKPFHRIDHIGIYLLIAGTYTPIVWSMMRGPWLWGTLSTVWTIAILSAARVWFGGVMPIWISTPIYLAMGWGSLFCYRELARTYSHRKLLPLPLGGIFYSVGAVINLLKWPILVPGVFGAHELFHLFVIAGSASHVFFMLSVVIPAPSPRLRPVAVRSPAPVGIAIAVPAPALMRSRTRPALLLRWARAMLSRRVRRWMLHLPHPRWLEVLLIDPREGISTEGPAEVV